VDDTEFRCQGRGGDTDLRTGRRDARDRCIVFGDASFKEASSSSLTITITKGVPQISISYSVGDPSGTPPTILMPVSQVLEVPVEVSSAAGQLPVGGTITVTYGSQSQTVTLSPVSFPGIAMMGVGIATFDNNTPGTYALNASYTGDANLQPIATAYNPSQVTVYTDTLASTTTTLTANTTNITPEGQLTVTVHVTGGASTRPAISPCTRLGSILFLGFWSSWTAREPRLCRSLRT